MIPHLYLRLLHNCLPPSETVIVQSVYQYYSLNTVLNNNYTEGNVNFFYHCNIMYRALVKILHIKKGNHLPFRFSILHHHLATSLQRLGCCGGTPLATSATQALWRWSVTFRVQWYGLRSRDEPHALSCEGGADVWVLSFPGCSSGFWVMHWISSYLFAD